MAWARVGSIPGTAARVAALAELMSTLATAPDLDEPALRRATLTCLPSLSLPARLGSRCGSASGSKPPAAARPSPIRSDAANRYRPGLATAPLTYTTTMRGDDDDAPA